MSSEKDNWLRLVYDLMMSGKLSVPRDMAIRLVTEWMVTRAYKEFASRYPEQAQYLAELLNTNSALSTAALFAVGTAANMTVLRGASPAATSLLADALLSFRRLAVSAASTPPEVSIGQEQKILGLLRLEAQLIEELVAWLKELPESDRSMATEILARLNSEEIQKVFALNGAARLEALLLVKTLGETAELATQHGYGTQEFRDGILARVQGASGEPLHTTPSMKELEHESGETRASSKSLLTRLYDQFLTVCRALFTKGGKFSSGLLREIRDKGSQLLRFLVVVALLLIVVPPFMVGLGVLFQNDVFFSVAGIFSFLALALLLLTFYPVIALLQMILSRRKKDGTTSDAARPAERYLNLVLSLLLLDGLMTLYAMIFPLEKHPYFILLLGICLLMLIALSFRYQEGLGRILRVVSAVVICALFVATSFALTFPKTAHSLKQALGRVDLVAGTKIGESISGPNFDSLGVGRVLVAFTPEGWVQYPVETNYRTCPRTGVPLDTLTGEVYEFLAREKAGQPVRYYFELDGECRVYERPGYTQNVDSVTRKVLIPVVGSEQEMRAESCLAELRAREIHQAESTKVAQDAAARAAKRQRFMAYPNSTEVKTGRGVFVFNDGGGSEVLESDIQRAVIQGLNTQGVKVNAAFTTEAARNAWGAQLIEGRTGVLNSVDFFDGYRELWVFRVFDATAKPQSGQQWNCQGRFDWQRLTPLGSDASDIVKVPGVSRSETNCLNQIRQAMVDSMIAVVTRSP